MKLFTTVTAIIVLAQAIFRCAEGHTVLIGISYKGVKMTTSCYHPARKYYNGPVGNITSTDIRCNVESSSPPSQCKIAAGTEVSLHWSGPGHPGPLSVYLAPLGSKGNGKVWFKIWEHVYDTKTSKWGSDDIVPSPYVMKATIPANLKSGKYILRGELIGLHGSVKLDGYQIYAGCFDINVTGGGSGVCNNRIAIPGKQYATKRSSCVYVPNFYYGFNAASYRNCGQPVCKLTGRKAKRTLPESQ